MRPQHLVVSGVTMVTYSWQMLGARPFVGFLLITDAARAKQFYGEVLGLPLLHEDDFAIVMDAGGTPLRLSMVAEVPEPSGTSAGWLVEDVNTSAQALAAAGVEFERFPGMDQDSDGVWRASPDGRVAWFRDPDGNRLSLTNRP
jgi:catechol 2,3-dioxygenase-like lactoylglutathione lyase family enzyme